MFFRLFVLRVRTFDGRTRNISSIYYCTRWTVRGLIRPFDSVIPIEMSKKNKIAYIKPNEPAFIKRLKQEANFKEGPSIDTKVSSLAPPIRNRGDINFTDVCVCVCFTSVLINTRFLLDHFCPTAHQKSEIVSS